MGTPTLEDAVRFAGWAPGSDMARTHQYDVLMRAGLQPGHALLEIGAGPLALGEQLIAYLDPQNYHALEPNDWLVDAAGISQDMFTLYTFDDFMLTRAGKTFDFVFSHSVFPHADRAMIRTMLSEGMKVLRPGGTFVASFYDQKHGDSEHKGWLYPMGVAYTAEFIEELARDAGYVDVETFAGEGHPHNHSWLTCTAFCAKSSLAEESAGWEDSEADALEIRDRFTDNVNADPGLKAHRDFVDEHVYGFGERSFHWLWKLIVDEMLDKFTFLEVGVYKGQVLSLVRLLADRSGKKADITGVTMLSSFSGVTGEFPEFPDDDYREHIQNLHGHFNQEMPTLVVGDSTASETQEKVAALGLFDVVYVDGCHEYDFVVRDLLFYGNKLVKLGGLLVIDDAACFLKQPYGFFQGIQPVADAVRAVIETSSQWVHVFTVVHNRVFRRVA